MASLGIFHSMSSLLYVVIDFSLLAARLALAIVFLVAAVAKLADPAGSRQALIEFGTPVRLVTALKIGLPVTELAVAFALLPVAAVHWAALTAVLLLAVFTAAIARAIRRGDPPECRCFGQLSRSPVGPRTLVRNALLMAIAALLAAISWWYPGPSFTAPLTTLATATGWPLLVASLSALMFGGGLLFLGIEILRQQGRILIRLDGIEEALVTRGAPVVAPVAASVPTTAGNPTAPGLRIGAAAPWFSVEDLGGGRVELDGLLRTKKLLLLIFMHPHCGPCQALVPEVARWQRDSSSELTIAVVTEGTAEENRAKYEAHGISQVLVQQKREVAEVYQAWGTPAAVLIERDGTICSALAQGAESIRRLVAGAANRGALSAPLPAVRLAIGNGHDPAGAAHAVRAGARKGEVAPSLELQAIDGRKIALADLRGRAVLVLFWNPKCGFCQQMLGRLKKWEIERHSEGPTLLLVSTGTPDENREMGLRSLIALDPGFQAGTTFGAGGTPMGILIDSGGRIASEIVAGADAVFALANASLRDIEAAVPA
jgi:peroxiredoxin